MLRHKIICKKIYIVMRNLPLEKNSKSQHKYTIMKNAVAH